MNASIAIQVLPTVDSKKELIRIVDEAIVCIESGAPDVMTHVKINLDPTALLTMDLKTAKHREVTGK